MGRGVLGLQCSVYGSYTVLIDVSPCAVYCSLLDSRRMGLDVLVDVAQCDNMTCIIVLRCLSEGLAVYNMPYLPVEDEGLEGLAWSGGIHEAERLARLVSTCKELKCVTLVYFSLSGSDKDVLDSLRRAGIAVKKNASTRSLRMYWWCIVARRRDKDKASTCGYRG